MRPVDARVSVILPVYNRESYVGEAIQSVLAQSRPPDELIVVDDGSTDRSREVVEGFESAILRVVRQKNAGIGAARNRGLEVASGDLIAFIDSDDIWTGDKLALQIRALEENAEIMLVFGHLLEFLSPERALELGRSLRVSAEPIPGVIATTVLARREAVRQIGLFDVSLRVGEFIDWVNRACELGLPSVVLPATVARRRIHGGNAALTQDRSDYLRVIKSALDRRRRVADYGR